MNGDIVINHSGVEITTDVLDSMNTGKHDLATVRHARKVLEAAGFKVQRHRLEIEEATRLRKLAATTLREAETLDGRQFIIQEMR